MWHTTSVRGAHHHGAPLQPKLQPLCTMRRAVPRRCVAANSLCRREQPFAVVDAMIPVRNTCPARHQRQRGTPPPHQVARYCRCSSSPAPRCCLLLLPPWPMWPAAIASLSYGVACCYCHRVPCCLLLLPLPQGVACPCSPVPHGLLVLPDGLPLLTCPMWPSGTA